MIGALLYWVGVVGGFAAIAYYFVALALRPKWVRLWSGLALLLTGVGLMQAAIAVRFATVGPTTINAAVAIVVLFLSVAIQAYSIVRGRRERDGADRRQAPQA